MSPREAAGPHWRVANAPCSWGTIENTGTDAERIDAATFLDEVAETGYDGTELGDLGFLPTEPDALERELSARGLALPAAWVTVRLDDPGRRDANVRAALATARLVRAVGGDGAVVNLGPDHSRHPVRTARAGRIRPEDGLDAAGMDAYAAEAVHVARAVRDATDLRCAFHPHGASWIETPEEIDAFLARTDPDLLGLVFDTGHVALGGGEPVAALGRWHDRVALVHLKDFDPAVVLAADREGWGYPDLVRHGVFPELGRGVVDLGAVLTRLRDAGYEGWLVVEQDVLPGLGSPKRSASRNRRHLRELGA